MHELPNLKSIIEAALLASAHPLSLPQLSGLFEGFESPSHDDLSRAIAQLGDDCAGRGVELVEVASGFRYQVRQDVHPFVSRLWTERQTRYSRALLETLSLIAYRQPITRGEIEQIRGVAVSTSIVRTLEEREWVRIVGYRDVPGKPELLGTTRQFLDYFKLKSLDELPALSEIRDIDDLELQLDLDAAHEAGSPDAPVDEAINGQESAADPVTAHVAFDAATQSPDPTEPWLVGDHRDLGQSPTPDAATPAGDDEQVPESVV